MLIFPLLWQTSNSNFIAVPGIPCTPGVAFQRLLEAAVVRGRKARKSHRAQVSTKRAFHQGRATIEKVLILVDAKNASQKDSRLQNDDRRGGLYRKNIPRISVCQGQYC